MHNIIALQQNCFTTLKTVILGYNNATFKKTKGKDGRTVLKILEEAVAMETDGSYVYILHCLQS